MKKHFLSIILVCAMCAIATSTLSGCKSSEGTGTTYDAKTVLSTNSYDVTDYVELGDISEVDISGVEKPEDVDDEYTKAYLDYLLAAYPDYTVSDHTTVQEGDAVNIDYIGTIDGEEFDGGSAEDYYLEIGSGTFIEGFESGLIGCSKGDQISLDLVFPEDYGDEDYAGKAVNYQVTINGIYESNYFTSETVTDEFISENFGYDTVDAYLEYLKEYLATANEYNYKFNVQNEIIEQLESISKVDIPDELIDAEKEGYRAYYTNLAEEAGQTLDEYISENLGYETFDDYKNEAGTQIEAKVEQDLIFQALALELGTSFTEEEFNSFVSQQMEYNNVTEDGLYLQYGGTREKTMVIFLESIALDQFSDQLESKIVDANTLDDAGSAG